MTREISTTCCITGGGPAGMMLGLLLARSGIDVTVIEKYPDFFRDFRGDTIHPSTMQILDELGLLEEFLKIPHYEFQQLTFNFEGQKLTIVDFSKLPVKCPFIGIMPQWDFLNFIATEAKKYPNFHLLMNTTVSDIIVKDDVVVGVKAQSENEQLTICAKLVVGADGRHSTIRDKAGFEVVDVGAPMDVLWFRLSRKPSDTIQTLGNIKDGKMFVLINRGDYWQCGYVIAKGSLEKLRHKGLELFGEDIVTILPFLKDRVGELKGWEDVKLLDVRVNHLLKWYRSGLICIGDAAHAMSPIGGVGINLAIQDAVAAANALTDPLSSPQPVPDNVLKSIQKRREFPTWLIQKMQVIIQNNVIKEVLSVNKKPPLLMRMLNKWPLLRRIPARLIGLGWRMEHIRKDEG